MKEEDKVKQKQIENKKYSHSKRTNYLFKYKKDTSVSHICRFMDSNTWKVSYQNVTGGICLNRVRF